jgi:hypothetical protein
VRRRVLLGARRTRAHAGLVALLALTVALIVGAIAGTQAHLDAAAVRAVRAVLASGDPAGRFHQVVTRLDDDVATQADGVAGVLADVLPADREVWHTVRTFPLRTATDARLVLLTDPSIADHAELVTGVWPTGPGETALHAEAATALGVGLGDSLEVAVEDTTAALTLVGTWRPTDHPHWGAEPLAAAGSDPLDPGAHGPAVVLPEALAGLDLTPFAQWTVSPGPGITPADLGPWRSGLARLPDALRDFTHRGLSQSGELTTTLADTDSGLASVRAAALIPLLVLALLSLVVLWQLARLLAAVRERETLVLLSRGGSRQQLTTAGGIEAVLITLPGAALGASAVLLAFAGRPGVDLATPWLLAAAVAAVATAVLLANAAHAATTGLRTVGETGRATAVLAPGALVLVLLATAFTLWRYIRNASPLVPGTARPDLVAVAAPAVALVAFALLAVVLAGPVTRALATAAGRTRGYSPAAELRQVSRRIPVNAVLVVLVVLAAGTTALACAYSGTWQALRTMSAQVAAGADVTADLGAGVAGPTTRGVTDAGALDGVTAATGVVQLPLRLDDLTVLLTALPARDAGVSSAPDSVLGAAEATLLQPAEDVLAGLDVPSGELPLTVTVSATTPGLTGIPHRTVGVSAWLHDGVELVRLDAGELRVRAENDLGLDAEGFGTEVVHPDRGRPVTAALTVTVPPGSWRLVAVDTALDTTFAPTAYMVAVEEIGAPDLLAGSGLTWGPVLPPPEDNPAALGGPGMSFTADLTATAATFDAPQRLMPAREGIPTVPVLTTPGWEDQIRAAGTDVTVGVRPVRLVRVGGISVVPGNSEVRAGLADLPTLQDALLRTSVGVPAISELWLATGEPDAVAGRLRELVGPRAPVEVASSGVPDPVSAPARTAFWAAVASALLLVLPAVGAVALAQATTRRGEVVVLRAVGVGPAQQARSRRNELLGLVLGAVAAGITAGAAVAHLVIVDLVRATTPQVSRAVPVAVAWDLPLGALFLGALLAALMAVAVWYGRRVRSQVRDTEWREEIR